MATSRQNRLPILDRAIGGRALGEGEASSPEQGPAAGLRFRRDAFDPAAEQPEEAPEPGRDPRELLEAERRDLVTRRGWMKLVGATMALAGAHGCQPEIREKILPYVHKPADVVPGVPRHYATAMTLSGFATGLLVESVDGRPIKVEGNPLHPASLGATGPIEQASVLGLYDPSRRVSMRRKDAGAATFDEFAALFGRDRPDRGAGLRIVLEPTGSPLAATLLERIRERFPEARFVLLPPVEGSGAADGARLALGRALAPIYAIRRADVIASLDADFLGSMPFRLRYARELAERRSPGTTPETAMNRLYVVEPAPTITGRMADHRLARRAGSMGRVAAALAAELVRAGRRPPGMPDSAVQLLDRLRDPGPDAAWIAAVARDLARAGGAALVLIGPRQPPEIAALEHPLNAALGGDRVVRYVEPSLVDLPGATQDLAALAKDIDRGAVDTLVVLEANIVYSAPPDLQLARRLAEVPLTAYLGAHEDETSKHVSWFVPAAHYLESWGDARAYDGTVSLVQPLVTPLYGGRTVSEVLAVLAGERNPSAHALLRAHWARRFGERGASRWADALRTGVVAGTASAAVRPTLDWDGLTKALERAAAAHRAETAIELSFAPSAAVHDGRHAPNAWLQELPDPITKLTWDNAAWTSAKTAERLGVATGDVVRIERAGRAIEIPILVVAGHADDALTLPLGYGRTGTGSVGDGVGVDVGPLRTSEARWIAGGATVKPLGRRKLLAITQLHFQLAGRPIVRSITLDEYRRTAADGPHREELPTLYPNPLEDPTGAGEQWAMSIDTSRCIGCGACVIACQAENNVLVVGREGVARSREMHWLRIDNYFAGDPADPVVVSQPMLCQHCEMAPCEYVCPVNATVHSPDGLNEMVYNRCVGTRFCSNNCPYKVRRFNWFDWIERVEANQGPVALQRNPEVTVRERGVMEKCTFCVQRIRVAEIAARVERRGLRSGEVTTACQQACPTRAIAFGSLRHPDTEVVAWRKNPRSYAVLGDLGTRPRVEYLVHVRNPNPEMPG